MGNVVSHALRLERGEDLLHKVAEGDVAAAHKMLEENRRLAIWTHWMDGTSPLHAATCCGVTELVKDIIMAAQLHLSHTRKPKAAQKALQNFVNLRNGLGQTSLELACKYGHVEIVQLLLASGGKALLQDHVHGRTCLHYAAIHGRAACIRLLLSDTPIATSAANGLLIRDAVLADGRSRFKFVDAPAALGYAPLHLAAGHGHGRAVEALLYGGADPRVRCLGRMFSTYLMPQRFKPAATPLHVAAVRGDLSTCASLLQFQLSEEPGLEDLRQLRDLCGDRPMDLVPAGSSLASLLNPDTPLEEALSEAEEELRQGQPRIQSLQELAAAALRTRLVAQLDGVQAAAAAAAAADASPRSSPPATPASTLIALLTPSQSAMDAFREPAPRLWSRTRDMRRSLGLRSDLDDCEICFVNAADAQVVGCRHELCCTCAKQLCASGKAHRGPSCPFCRGLIGGFHAAANG